MILLELNPLSPSVAIAEIVIILVAAALVGYLIGRWITKGRHNDLAERLNERTAELEDCRAQLHIPGTSYPVNEDVPVERDNLKKVMGIGPTAEKLLNDENIFTFTQLAAASPTSLLTILRKTNPGSTINDSQAWIEQASLARDGKWEELDKLQDRLSSEQSGNLAD